MTTQASSKDPRPPEDPIDEAVAESFPASDPPAHKVERTPKPDGRARPDGLPTVPPAAPATPHGTSR